MTELQIVLEEIGRLRTDLAAALVHHADQDREKHAELDVLLAAKADAAIVTEIQSTVSRWKGAAAALAAAWTALTAAAGLYLAFRGLAP